MIQHLIIEGNDSWVLAELWRKHLPNPKGYPTKEILKAKGFFKPAGGYENVPRLISTTLLTEGLTNLGIVVDANEKGVENRWDAIRNRLQNKFRKEILANFSPEPGGIIVKAEGLPTVGVWIMPDNQTNGYLEHFLSDMIPPKGKDELWNHTQQVLEDLQQQRFCEFSKIHHKKALVRTWLAWQKEPGLSYGTALSMGYFDAEVETAKPFVEWIANTFELEPVN